ncbi:hypothetical protein [Deefgea rivuli]|uniref:hypothetical protein n=1 Tax=Deefgea rivuli TaxID=400948 RepID=UPI00048292A0|nr:hypothetical protein [Deefgea rivuli]
MRISHCPRWLLGIVLALQLGSGWADIIVAVPKDVLSDYQKLLGTRNLDKIRDYSGEGSRRDTVELILFQQALRLGGLNDVVRFSAIDNYARSIIEVEAAHATALGTTVWAADIGKEKASLSVPTIREGEYQVGFYTLERNQKVLQANFKQLQKLTVISNTAWKNDIQVLEQLGISKVESAPTYIQIVKMLNAGRGDFMMASFKGKSDLSVDVEGIRLLPIKNMKIAMPGSRHFLIANTAQGQQVLTALNKGLTQLRKEGRIRRAYTDAGFFNQKVERWTLLNPPKK